MSALRVARPFRLTGGNGGFLSSTVAQRAARAAKAAAVAGALAIPGPWGAADALTYSQQMVADVWKEVNRQYVDPSFNGLGEEGWKKERLTAMKALDGSDNAEAAYPVIKAMLAKLGDPYTRFLTPEQYDALAAVATGKGAGVGVQLAAEAGKNGPRVVVLSTTRGAVAEREGVRGGDAIVAIDGVDTTGDAAEVVAARLRGPVGSRVDVDVLRSPGGRASFTMKREELAVGELESELLKLPGGKTVRLLKLSSFSKETPGQFADALRQPHGDAIVVDLRGNAGGFMTAGIDAAKMFLPPGAKVVAELRRDGTAANFFADGVGSDVSTPLFLLVDGRTASASEIMAAALHDNDRATLVGPAHTFGKGKIQNVQQLGDGAAISVTRAAYQTPSGKNIHGIGIFPDVTRKECDAAGATAACLEGLIP